MRFARIWWPESLRGRLLAVYGLSMALSALAIGTLVLLIIEPFDSYAMQKGLANAARDMARWVQFDAQGRPSGFSEHRIPGWMLRSFGEEFQLRITDGQGEVAFSPGAERGALSPAGRGFDPGLQVFSYMHQGVSMHAATAAVDHGGQTWYLQIAASDRLAEWLRQAFGLPALRNGMVMVGVIFLAAFLAATHWALQRMLKPLRLAAEQAQRITPQTLHARLQAPELPREFQPMVHAFNHVLDRLEAGFRNQQEFLAMAAHELKTPLALLRAQIEMEPPQTRNPHLLQDVDHMARQVQQLLHLAEASEQHQYRIVEVEAAGVVREACAYMARASEYSRIQVVSEIDPATRLWRADRGALFILLKNLIENAIQHSPAGSTVTVRAHAQGFAVMDQGCGVAGADLDQIFKRFWRSQERRDVGAGLGLSICQEIAHVHGWSIEARPGKARPGEAPGPEESTGLEVHVRFDGERL